MLSWGGGNLKRSPTEKWGVTQAVSGTWVPTSRPEGHAVGPDVEISMSSNGEKPESKPQHVYAFHQSAA